MAIPEMSLEELLSIHERQNPSGFDRYCGKLRVEKVDTYLGDANRVCIGSLLQENVSERIEPNELDDAGRQLVWIWCGEGYLRSYVYGDDEDIPIDLKEEFIDFNPRWMRPGYFSSSKAWKNDAIVNKCREHNRRVDDRRLFDVVAEEIRLDLMIMLYEHVVKAHEAQLERDEFWAKKRITLNEAHDAIQIARDDESVLPTARYRRACKMVTQAGAAACFKKAVKNATDDAIESARA